MAIANHVAIEILCKKEGEVEKSEKESWWWVACVETERNTKIYTRVMGKEG